MGDRDGGLQASEGMALEQIAREGYLEYAMYVTRERALPFVGDGLKPVQRRLLYAMSELGMRRRRRLQGTGRQARLRIGEAPQYKKSARTIGEVLGKYHPHGDQACYEAMVRLAQPFSGRHTVVDGQGNWGAIDDPSSFAAMRYTEARLTGYAETMVEELHEETVNWRPNFDGSTDEPISLPAQIPNLLVNGSQGIAVGMACDVPPHALGEVVQATCAMLQDPGIDAAGLQAYIPGPDFPGGGRIVSSKEEIGEAYQRGEGRIRLRCKYEKPDPKTVVITEMPWQVLPGRVIEQINDQADDGKCPWLDNVRDESTEELRIVVELKGRSLDADEIMKYLMHVTDLERTIRIGMRVIARDGNPVLMSLRDVVKEWIEYRRETVRRRTEYRLKKVEHELWRMRTLLTAISRLDTVFRILREEEDPKAAILRELDVDEEGAKLILETKLRELARLEKAKLQREQEQAERKRSELARLEASPKLRDRAIEAELKEWGELCANPRRTTIEPMARTSGTRVQVRTPAASREAVTVLLSEHGFMKTMKGHLEEAPENAWQDGDGLSRWVTGWSNDRLVLIDRQGRSYGIRIADLPGGKGGGIPLASFLDPEPGTQWVGMVCGGDEEEVLLTSRRGYGLRVAMRELDTRQRAGKQIMTHLDEAGPHVIGRIKEDEMLVMVTRAGYAAVICAGQARRRERGKGDRMIAMPVKAMDNGAEGLVYIGRYETDTTLTLRSGNRNVRVGPRKLAETRMETARRGTKIAKAGPIDEVR